MSHPAYTAAEARSRQTFLALMWALSYPGRIQTLPEDAPAFHLFGEALLDLETSFYAPDPHLAAIFSRNGARHLAPDQAAYHLYSAVTSAELAAIEQASVGTMLYPDRGATLFVGCTLGSGHAVTITGPGINSTQRFEVDGLPDAFWKLRVARVRFPLGWDVFFVDGQHIVGLPRSVTVI